MNRQFRSAHFLLVTVLCAVGSVANAQSTSRLLDGSSKTGSLDYFQSNLSAGLKFRLGNNLSLGGGIGSNRSRQPGQIGTYNLNLGYDDARWGLGGQYRRNASTPLLLGNDEFNAISTQGSENLAVAGWLRLTSQMRVSGEASFGQGLPGADFDFASWSTRLEYRFSRNAFGILGFDNLNLDMGGGSMVRQRMASLGVGYDMGSGSMFKLMIQYGELNAQRPFGASTAGTSRGQVISSQISIKF